MFLGCVLPRTLTLEPLVGVWFLIVVSPLATMSSLVTVSPRKVWVIPPPRIVSIGVRVISELTHRLHLLIIEGLNTYIPTMWAATSYIIGIRNSHQLGLL